MTEDVTIRIGEDIEYEGKVYEVYDIFPKRVGYNVTEEKQLYEWAVKLAHQNEVKMQTKLLSEVFPEEYEK